MLIVGVDEVGRGCLAGPVVAAAVGFPIGHRRIPGIDDSKRLSEKKRIYLDTLIRHSTSYIGIGLVEAIDVDRFGIVTAVSVAMKQACASLSATSILVDGPATLGLERIAPVTAIVHGDQLVYEISAASILAKVFRDNVMIHRSIDYPRYCWHANKGYGTSAHMKAIKQYGITVEHRRSFIH